MKEIIPIIPNNLGWLQSKLDKEEIDFLWQLIDKRGEDMKPSLVGQITSSYRIEDKNDWFFTNVLSKLGMNYEGRISNLGRRVPVNNKSYYLSNMWVNYQKQYEFNPVHDHIGVYSFVIWMKIPTEFKDQRELPIAKNTNMSVISNFCINYQNILGQNEEHMYEMSKEMEGTILFFPSQLLHTVYPFYNCEEDRISISGNIAVKQVNPIP
tara:strand:- start:79 stop:708 length:630 start_codon:yes stop_codon:yes gene_type:complete